MAGRGSWEVESSSWRNVMARGRNIRNKGVIKLKFYYDIKKQEIIVPANFGRMFNVCGSKLFFSNVKRTWLEASEMCCSFGMQLLTVENYNKMKCLHKQNFVVVKLNSNVNDFWTAGSDEGCQGSFWWHSGTGLQAPLIPGLQWEPKQPGGHGHCLRLYFSMDVLNTLASLSDNDCTERKYFACQTPWKFPSLALQIRNLTLNKKCDLPTCPKRNCSETTFLFNRAFKAPVSHGYMKIACNGTYFISNIKETYGEADQSCCQFGMQLVNIKSSAEMSCLVNAITGNGDSGAFYTSATDAQCTGRFAWCPSQLRLSPELSWLPARPAHFLDLQHCVVLAATAQGPNGLSDISCYRKFRYICEVAQ